MQTKAINRRNALKFIGVAAGSAVIPQASATSIKPAEKTQFTFCLNMATIHGQKLGFIKELEVAAKAGYGSVEIWIDTLKEYLQKGGTINEAKLRLNDLGVKVENCIAFSEWVVDDPDTRKKALVQMKSEMGMIANLGCKRIAATGKGLTSDTTISLDAIAERYGVVLDMGIWEGVIPLLEMWGFQKKMSTVSEVTYSVMQSGHSSAKILLDIFHIYKGNTPLDTLSFINPEINDILHMNDYPSLLSSAVITDADRIYPGDGVAPIKQILKTLKRQDQPLILSAELFNKNYYSEDALIVAKTALNKMKAVVKDI
jgi:2-keto-myo-inositol isomerase